MAVIMTPQNLQKLVTPIVTDVLDGIYDQREDEWRVFMEERKGQPYEFHQLSVMSGFGNAILRNPGQTTSYDTAQTLYTVQAYYEVYALAFALTKQMIDDSKVNVDTIKTFSRALGQSLVETKERNAANLLNNGFNTSYKQVGGDGQPLFSLNHPSAQGTGNRSNTLLVPAVLSQTSLEQMLINISKAKDARGKFIQLRPQDLVVPPALRFVAPVLLNSVLRSDTSNNALNAVYGELKGYKIVTRLTSDTAWFITTQGYNSDGILMLTREMPHTAQEGDFDTDSLRFKIQERYAFTWADFLCIYGTTGV